MPQLMPIVWIFSIVMSMMFMLMLVNMYYYKDIFVKSVLSYDNNYNTEIKW
nr:ATP synthase F0 subunit 8 [Parabathippus shelfordi]